METNQIIIRDVGFIQRTKDGYFNATKLLASWNKENKQQNRKAT